MRALEFSLSPCLLLDVVFPLRVSQMSRSARSRSPSPRRSRSRSRSPRRPVAQCPYCDARPADSDEKYAGRCKTCYRAESGRCEACGRPKCSDSDVHCEIHRITNGSFLYWDLNHEYDFVDEFNWCSVHDIANHAHDRERLDTYEKTLKDDMETIRRSSKAVKPMCALVVKDKTQSASSCVYARHLQYEFSELLRCKRRQLEMIRDCRVRMPPAVATFVDPLTLTAAAAQPAAAAAAADAPVL